MKFQTLIKSYPVALAAAVAFIVFGGLAFWRSSQEDDLKAVLVSREVESERLSTNVHNSAKLSTQLEQLAELIRKTQGRLSNPSDLAANQQYFYQLEAENHVKLAELHQGTQIARGTKKKSYTFYSVVPYTVRVQGEYINVLKFLRSIESGSRLSVITTGSLDLSGAQKKDEELSYAAPLVLALNLEMLGTP